MSHPVTSMSFSRDSRVLAEVARVAGTDGVEFAGEMPHGESRSTFIVAAGAEQLVVKVAPEGPSAL